MTSGVCVTGTYQLTHFVSQEHPKICHRMRPHDTPGNTPKYITGYAP